MVAIDVMDRQEGFVLEDALREYAARTRAEADDQRYPQQWLEWADTAERLLVRMEEAMSRSPQPAVTPHAAPAPEPENK
jgi:hypothetical protein